MRAIFSVVIILLYLSACSSDSAETAESSQNSIDIGKRHTTSNLAIPDNRFANTYQVLIFGNSHVSGLGSLIETLLKTGEPLAQVTIKNVAGGFLDDKSNQNSRENLLMYQPWTHVILQGQKYSQSGSHLYPTISAQVWIEMAKQHGITPILFPEHPQRGNALEGRRVHLIHTGIAEVQKSCVAPVGLAWDKVIATSPQMALHSVDGNHASIIGRLLTAYVFYEVISGGAADLLPFIDNIGVEEATQRVLRQHASATIQSNQACDFE